MGISDEIRKQSSMRRIFDYYGIREVRNGQYICPFHADHKPSMTILDDKFYQCWTCGSKGSVLDFIKNYEEIQGRTLTWQEVYQRAIDIQGLNISLGEKKETYEEQQKRKIGEILSKAVDISQKNMTEKNSDIEYVRDYLAHRKISDAAIRTFHIGFEYNNNFIKELVNTGNYTLKELQDAGIVKVNNKGQYYDTFYNRVLIPIYDQYGKNVGFGGRILPKNTTSTSVKYINTSETPVFKKSEILFNYHNAKREAEKQKELVMLEGYFDVVSAFDLGFKNAVALMGVALSDYQINMIKKLNCDLVLALDNDKIGKATMLKLIPMLMDKGITTSVYDISLLDGNYKDFGELLENNVSKEEIDKTKISAFDFLLKHKYFIGKNINTETIYSVYNQLNNDGIINDTRRELMYRDFVISNSDISKEEFEKIIHPSIVDNKFEKAKNAFFAQWLRGKMIKYAQKNNDRALLTYSLEKFDSERELLMNELESGDYITEDGYQIRVLKFINYFVKNLPEYRELEKDISYKFEKFLDNCYILDKNDNKQRVYLTPEQKNIVVKQFIETAPENMKEKIINTPELFNEMVIADNIREYDSLFPKSHMIIEKKGCLDYFAKGNVAFVWYAQSYRSEQIPNLLAEGRTDIVCPEKLDFNVVVVFNNTNKSISIDTKNYIPPEKENEIEVSKESNEKNKGFFRQQPVIAVEMGG